MGRIDALLWRIGQLNESGRFKNAVQSLAKLKGDVMTGRVSVRDVDRIVTDLDGRLDRVVGELQ